MEPLLPVTPAPAPRRPLWRAVALGAACGVCVAALVTHAAPASLTPSLLAAQTRSVVPIAPAVPPCRPEPALNQPHARAGDVVRAPTLVQRVGQGLAALSLTAMAHAGTPLLTPAAEVDLLAAPTPTNTYVYDDGALLSRSSAGGLQARLPEIERKTGFRINVITLRKLIVSDDAFQFADNLIETWYPTAELGDKKAVLVIVRNSKEGGLVGGPAFSKAVPSDLVESIATDNLGKLLTQEKFNQAIESTVDRLEAVLTGQPDPGPPKLLFANEATKQSQTYKTKEETDEKRDLYTGIFVALVAISFVAPMVQYFGYTKDDR
jgi:uncharacterized membrane protein YgcG